MTRLVDHILNAPTLYVYALVALLVFAEDALFVGFVLPGETAAVLGGVVASRHHAHLTLVLVIVVVAAIVGDTVGYEVGRRFGPSLLQLRSLQRHEQRLGDAQDFLARRGGSAVFLGRFVAFFRAVIPALAGTARMPYRKFLSYNASGGLVWGTTFVLVGYLAGNSYQRIEKVIGRDAAFVIAGTAVVAFVVWRFRRRRGEQQDESAPR